MEPKEIATKADVVQATQQIIDFIKESLQDVKTTPVGSTSKKYLRSRDVRKMFGVSPNKFKDMRLKGEIPFIKRGSTFYYPEDELIKSMSKDLNNSQA
jgi:hypothetical protein